MDLKKKKYFIFLLILSIGFFFRFFNLNWDSYFHLHPDERFLTMVAEKMKIPKSINEYLNPQVSQLNPSNIGYRFFVYGVFPLILNKILAIYFKMDNYNDFTILGRTVSAFFDFLIIILVYKTVKLLFDFYPSLKKNRLALLSAFFYAIAVYPIQSSHFFTVDTFLNFFMFFSFYFALKSAKNSSPFNIFFSAVFFSLALASKISAIFILPLILIFLFKKPNKRLRNIFLFFGISYLVLRLADPYYFQNSNFLYFHLNQNFTESIRQLKSFEGKNIWYPPAVQWINKPFYFVFQNLMLVGVGLPYFILILLGAIFFLKMRNKKEFLIILIWVLAYLIYLSFQFVKSIRYTIFLYPFFAIFAAIGFNWVLNRSKSLILNFVILMLLMIWPLMFFTIYLNKHTRVEASEWIYKKLSNGSFILSEHWDDPLPLPLEENYGKQFLGEQLPVFDPDTKEKWEKIERLLDQADYYILSSNRGWGSIPTVPEKYPKMSKFYKNLLDSNCQFPQPARLRKGWLSAPCYIKIKEFKPFYYRFFELSNYWVDESFTVYDHPTVLIFENVRKH